MRFRSDHQGVRESIIGAEHRAAPSGRVSADDASRQRVTL